MTSIDGLFEQIIHYEKTAQERKNRLQELKQSVFTTQEKGKVLQQTCCDLHNKLKQKLLELSDKELISKWLSGQEAIYQQQVTELDQQLHNIHKEKQTVEKQLEEEKENFFSRVAVFTHHYGTSNHGSKERELLYSSQLADILKDKEKLSSGLEVYKTREEEVSRLMKKRQELRNQLDKLEQENKKLTSSLREELQKTSDLEDQRVSVTNIPATDSEFISQQEELEHEKQISVNLEDQYTQLQSQLHTLHQKIWQQQLNQRQQQLQQGQQQQQHHQYNPNSQQQQQQQKLNQQQQQQHHQYNLNSQQRQQQPNQGRQRKLPWKRHTEHYELNVSQKVDTSSKVDTSRKLLVTSSSQQNSSQDDFSEEVMEEMFNSSDEFKPVTMTTDSPN